MFSAKVSVVKSLMVVGKLSILLSGSIAYANPIDNPRFFEYQGGAFINRLVDFSFGWFKTLDNEQKVAYSQALTHAVMMSENGQAVRWYHNNASGYAVPVHTWPTGNGYCRRVHVQAIAYSTEKTMSATACYSNSSSQWQWINDKY